MCKAEQGYNFRNMHDDDVLVRNNLDEVADVSDGDEPEDDDSEDTDDFGDEEE